MKHASKQRCKHMLHDYDYEPTVLRLGSWKNASAARG